MIDDGRKMRSGGGGRIMCSPYFVGATFIMLLVVTVKYWSLSSSNSELNDKLEELQLQLRSESFNVKNLQSNIKVKDGQVDTLQKRVSDLNTEVDRLTSQYKEAEESMGTIRRENVQCSNHLTEAQDQLEACNQGKQDSYQQESRFRQQLEEKDNQIQGQENQLQDLRQKLEQAWGELNTLKNREMQQAQPLQPHLPGYLRGSADKGSTPPGELPDVKVNAVHVREKAVQDNEGEKDDNAAVEVKDDTENKPEDVENKEVETRVLQEQAEAMGEKDEEQEQQQQHEEPETKQEWVEEAGNRNLDAAREEAAANGLGGVGQVEVPAQIPPADGVDNEGEEGDDIGQGDDEDEDDGQDALVDSNEEEDDDGQDFNMGEDDKEEEENLP